jgi:hypothetical protein
MPERRTTPRKKFEYYMSVHDEDTGELLGHLVQISIDGLQLETIKQLPIDKEYYLHLELTAEVADRPYMVFIARTRWCKMDDVQPNLFRVGFSIVEILPDDKQIFINIITKYGS